MSTFVDYCTIEDRQTEHRRFWVSLVLGTIAAAGMATFVNTMFLTLLSFAGVDQGTWIAGITEPIITKLLPALVVVGPLLVSGPMVLALSLIAAIVANAAYGFDTAFFTLSVTLLPGAVALGIRPPLHCWRPRDWFPLGVIGGFVFGYYEVIVKIIDPDAFWESLTVVPWQSPAFVPEMIPPVVGHMVWGGIVMGAVFLWRTGRTTPWGVFAALITTGAFHFAWNTWFVRQEWFWLSVREVLG
jgi:hypothetical protein